MTIFHSLISNQQPSPIVVDETIISQRKALKHKITRGEYKTFIDEMLDAVGVFIQKTFTHTLQPVPFLVSACVIALSIIITSLITSLLAFEFGNKIRVNRLPSEIALTLLIFLGLVITKSLLDATIASWRDYLIDAIEMSRDLLDLEKWFDLICKKKWPLILSTCLGITFGIYATCYVSVKRGGFIGLGPAILDILVDIFMFIGLYYIVLFVNLPLRVQHYHFRLFELSPKKSFVIHELRTMLFNFVWGMGLLATAVTGVLGIFAIMNWINFIILLLLGWLPIIASFMISQFTLSRIMDTAKWHILEEIQQKIEALQSQQDITDKNTIEEVTRLLSIHDLIWSSSTSLLDVRSMLVFVNTLLLPIFTFLITHIPALLSSMNMPWQK